jgi:mRNA-degrading endonuclease YafQ of YafQ-DinJ toxin-antitoxin module
VKKDPRWQPIFNRSVSFTADQRSAWQYVIDCLINDQPLPSYFYEHPLILPKHEQQIKQRLVNKQLTIHILELHFDGHMAIIY